MIRYVLLLLIMYSSSHGQTAAKYSKPPVNVDSIQSFAASSSPFLLDDEFASYLGGSSYETIYATAVDAQGSFYLCGRTTSTDFPLKNSIGNTLDPVHGVGFVVKVNPDGSRLDYSTIIPGTYDVQGCSLDGDGNLWITGQTSGDANFPISTNAFHSNRQAGQAYIMELNPSGDVRYASYYGNGGTEGLRIRVRQDGTIIVAGASEPGDAFPYITQGTVRTASSNSDTFLSCFSPSANTVLWGTYLGLEGTYHLPKSLDVDPSGNIYFIGYDFTLDKTNNPHVGIPLVHSFIDTGKGILPWACKLTPDGTRFIYSTYVGTMGGDIAFAMLADSKGKLHIAGATLNTALPMKNAVRTTLEPRGGTPAEGYYMRIAPNGDLEQSTYIGGNNLDEIRDLSIDQCGHIYFHGSTRSTDLPMINSRVEYHTPESYCSLDYILVLDPSSNQFIYGTYWNDVFHKFENWDELAENQSMSWLTPEGDYYFAYLDIIDRPITPIHLQNAYQSVNNGEYDLTYHHLHIPLCTKVVCDMQAPDSAVVYKHPTGTTIPEQFSIDVVLNNTGNTEVHSIVMEVVDIANASLDPATQPTLQTPAPNAIGPGFSTTATWTILPDPNATSGDNVKIEALVFFTYADGRSSYSMCSIDIPVAVRAVEETNLSCKLALPNEVTFTDSDTGYKTAIVTATLTIKNNGTNPASYENVTLEFPDGMGMLFDPGTPSIQTGTTLAPGAEKVHTWRLLVSARAYVRELEVMATAWDNLGIDISHCTSLLNIPDKPPLACSLELPGSVLYNTATGLADPDTFAVRLSLLNMLDTTLDYATARFEEAQLQSFALTSGQSVDKVVSGFSPHQRSGTFWSLYSSNIAAPSLETIRVKYRFRYATEWEACESTITIDTTRVEHSACTISAPDELTADDVIYTPNPFDLDYTLLNTGNAQLDVAEITIQLPAHITTTDALTRSVAPLAASTQHEITWSLTVLTSAYEREAVISVVAKDAEGNILSSCEHRLFIPGVDGLSCDAGEDVALVFNIDESRYEPSVFSQQVTVYNQLDTALTNVEIEASVSSNEIAITSPSPANDAVSVIPANDTWITNWEFNVIGSDVPTTVTVTYRTRSDQYPEWRECSFEVIVPPREYTYCADCLADGIDTVWIDRSNEIMYPVPFQVYTAVTNNCTGILTDIQCTISMPARLSLAPGEPASQMIDLLKPGETMYVIWMLTAAIGSQDDALPVQITINNGALAPIICEHMVYIQHSNNIQLAAAKKLLYFRAAKDGALPAAQEIVVYAGFPIEMPWTAQYPAWLDIAPNASPTLEIVSVQPNTTALPMQRHYGTIAYTSAHPNAPKNVEVIYDIVATVGTSRIPSAAQGIVLHQNYPNPFASSTTISYTTDIPQSVSISVYNTLGVAVREVQQEAVSGNNTVQLTDLKPGLYMVVLRGKSGIASRIMLGR